MAHRSNSTGFHALFLGLENLAQAKGFPCSREAEFRGTEPRSGTRPSSSTTKIGLDEFSKTNRIRSANAANVHSLRVYRQLNV